jgi:hypothetical protein
MLVGRLVIGPAENEILERNSEATWKLIAGASYDVLALAVATVLSVFKPGGSFVARRATHIPKSIRAKK